MIIVEKILFLKRISIFSSLSSQELRMVSQVTQEEEFEQGELLFAQGDRGDSMFFVLDGRISIFAGVPPKIEVLTVFEKGDFFGEMGLFDDKPRSASAMALEPSRLLVLHKSDFRELIAEYPEVAFGIMKELNKRIRDTNQRLTSLEGRILDKDTRLYSRTYFEECLASELLKAKKLGTSLAFLVISTRKFKAGSGGTVPEAEQERFLADMGKILIQHLRPYDLLARFDHERLVAMLTDTGRIGGDAVKRRIDRDVAKLLAVRRDAHGIEIELAYDIIEFPTAVAERGALLAALGGAS